MRLDRGRHGSMHVGRRHGAFRRRRLKAGRRCEKHQCHDPTNTFHCSRRVCPGDTPRGYTNYAPGRPRSSGWRKIGCTARAV